MNFGYASHYWFALQRYRRLYCRQWLSWQLHSKFVATSSIILFTLYSALLYKQRNEKRLNLLLAPFRILLAQLRDNPVNLAISSSVKKSHNIEIKIYLASTQDSLLLVNMLSSASAISHTMSFILL